MKLRDVIINKEHWKENNLIKKALEKNNTTLYNCYCWSWNISGHRSKHEAQIYKQCPKYVEEPHI